MCIGGTLASTARTDENVETVHHLLTEDRRTTLQMIADHLNIGKETVCWIKTWEKVKSVRDLFLTP